MSNQVRVGGNLVAAASALISTTGAGVIVLLSGLLLCAGCIPFAEHGVQSNAAKDHESVDVWLDRQTILRSQLGETVPKKHSGLKGCEGDWDEGYYDALGGEHRHYEYVCTVVELDEAEETVLVYRRLTILSDNEKKIYRISESDSELDSESRRRKRKNELTTSLEEESGCTLMRNEAVYTLLDCQEFRAEVGWDPETGLFFVEYWVPKSNR